MMIGTFVVSLLALTGVFSMLPPGGLVDEQRLLTDLLRDYDPKVRPLLALHNYSGGVQQVEVTITLQIQKLQGINSKEQTFKTNGWITVQWNDARLKWNPDDYGGIEEVYLPPSTVWLPRFTLESSAADSQYEEGYYKWFWVSVYNDGVVSWEPGGSFKSKCKIDITMFPFDYQICEIIFGNWVYPSYYLNLSYVGEDNLLEKYTENGEWDIVNTSVWREDIGYAGWYEIYPKVHYVFLFRRKPLFFIVNLIIPCVLLCGLVLMVFRLPPGSGEKISMGVTLLFSYFVFILMISENVPETSDAVPVIVIYLITFMGNTCITVAMSVFVLDFHHRDGTQRPGHCLKVAVLGLARIVPFNVRYLKLQHQNKHTQPNVETAIATTLTPPASSPPAVDNQDKYNSHEDSILEPAMFESKRNSDKSRGKETIGVEEQDAARREWNEIAAIIDTFSLWASVLILILATVFLLVVWPIVYPKPTFDV